MPELLFKSSLYSTMAPRKQSRPETVHHQQEGGLGLLCSPTISLVPGREPCTQQALSKPHRINTERRIKDIRK